jgi:hypothetical protein
MNNFSYYMYYMFNNGFLSMLEILRNKPNANTNLRNKNFHFSIRIVDHKNRRISEIYPAKILTITNKDYSTSNELFQLKLGNIIAHKSKKKLYNFQINSLCTIFCNFVKESTPNFIEFSQSLNYNEDISLLNADSSSKLIFLIARYLFYMFSHFDARISFPAFYKNRRVKVFFLSVNLRKIIYFT